MIAKSAGHSPPKRALIADDHGLYRAGLAYLLKDEFGFSEVIEAANSKAAVLALQEYSGIDIAFFDLWMPGMSAPESLRVLREMFPVTRLVVVSASEKRSDILSAIDAGFNGFIPKSLTESAIVRAIEIILTAGIFVPSQMAQLPTASSAPAPLEPAGLVRQDVSAPPPRLTMRQQDVMTCVREGLSNKAIAHRLDIAEGTVKIHVATLFAAYKVRNRTALALYH